MVTRFFARFAIAFQATRAIDAALIPFPIINPARDREQRNEKENKAQRIKENF